MESVDSSDKLLVSGSSGYVNDQEQDAIIKTITSRAPSGEEGYTKENEITVINFDKLKTSCMWNMFSNSEINKMPWET